MVTLDPAGPAGPASNSATDGIARMCGPAASPIIILATLGVSLAMGTSALLVVTKRADVARVGAALNLFAAAVLAAIAVRQGSGCAPIGVMAASLPGLVGIAAFVLSLTRARQKNEDREAKSG